MLSKKALRELLEATSRYPNGFVVLEENKPKFVILDYAQYQKMTVQEAQIGRIEEVPAPKRILVSGGAGYIGSHAARLLAGQGHEITTIDNLSTGRRDFAQGRFIEGDLADGEFLDRVFAEGKFDAVLHFAASIAVEESVHNPLLYYRNNVVNGLNLLEAMHRHGVTKLVFSSTSAVYADDAPIPVTEESKTGPASPYGESKLVFEKILSACAAPLDLDSVILRYFNAAGASFDQTLGPILSHATHLIPTALNVALGRQDVLPVFGNDYATQDGTAIRDYIHVLDLAEAHALALQYLFYKHGKPKAEIFNIGTESGYSVLEIINSVCEFTGRMVRFEFSPRRAGDREKIVANISKARRVLGFEPKYSDLRTIVETSWAWQKKYYEQES